MAVSGQSLIIIQKSDITNYNFSGKLQFSNLTFTNKFQKLYDINVVSITVYISSTNNLTRNYMCIRHLRILSISI